jgi:SAM-dependent methyltransferase
VCRGSFRGFLAAGTTPRADAACPGCGALERHRLVWLYFERRTDLFDGRPKRMLHVAPEPCLEQRLRRRLRAGYLAADLDPRRAAVRLDVTHIDLPDASFDVVYASHVFEHVPDDRRAMRELRRVLRPDGFAVLIVPITATATIEDPSLPPAERARRFGQADHVRRYGPDYVDRLREAGFRVEAVSGAELVPAPEDRVRLGLTAAAGLIHRCTPA